MRVIYPQLGGCGRYGNQLFQVAATIGAAAANGHEPLLPADWDYRPYLSLPERFYESDAREFLVHASELAQHINPSERMYLQDWNMFKEIEHDIRNWFAPSPRALEVMQDRHGFSDLDHLPRPILSVHVRRGDNVQINDPGCPDKHLYHPLLDGDYYTRAEREVALDCPTVFVFSDDIPWCREVLPAALGRDDLHYFEGVSRPREWGVYENSPVLDWIDPFFMAQCDAHIVSNSTYAWWGAFLSWDHSPLYPWPWFGPALAHINAELMFPAEWRRIGRFSDVDAA